MKKSLKLIPAIVMLLISAIMVSTTTFAWFSMNTTVTATGMQVKAKAEGGIVISNASKGSWGASANAVLTSVTEMLPTSTANLTNWYHGTSTNPASANASTGSSVNGAEEITLAKASELMYVDKNTNSAKDENEDVYALVTQYYIKSTTATALTTNLYIKSVSVEANGTQTEALNGALRVAVKYGSTFYQIYGSTASSTLDYYVGSQSSVQTTINAYNTANVQVTGVTSIPNTDGGAVLVEIYVWYEGEDTACMSNNIAGLTPDTLTVTVQFSTTNT